MKVCFAYLDPALGGMLFQIGYIIFTAFLATMAFCFKPIMGFFQKKIQRRKKKEENR